MIRLLPLFSLAVVAALAQAGSTPITIDFTVTVKGEPILNLTPAEVSLRVGGRERTITSLRLVQLAGGARSSTPEPFHVNHPTPAGRTFVFAADLRSIRSGRETPLREAMRAFVSSLGPGDRVALALMPNAGLTLDVTTNHERFVERVNALTGQAVASESASDLSCRSRATLEGLRGLLEGFSGGIGPTTVVFVSAALSGPTRDAPNSQFPGVCEVRPVLYQDIAAAAVSARAYIHAVDPEDAPAVGANRAGLEHLAGVANGRVISLAGAGRTGLVSLVAESSWFYLVTFDASPEEQSNARHRVELRVARRDTMVRTHPQVFIPARRINPPVNSREAVDLLADPRTFTGLSLRGTWYLSRDEPGTPVTLVPYAEVLTPNVTLSSAAIGVYAPDGTPVAGWKAPQGTSPLTTAFRIHPGRYRVRIAAATADGVAGVLDQDVDATLESRGAWHVGSLVLGRMRDGAFTPVLQFGQEPVAIGRVEVFGPATPGIVRFELAASPDGPAIVTVPGTLTPTTDPLRFISTGAIPIGGFLPGRWVVRAVVSPEGVVPLRAQRTLEKVAIR
jgi:hypothetical protein